MKFKTCPRKGFTLVELMVVIVVIGILMAISIPAYKKVREKAYVRTIEGSLRSIFTAKEVYFAENPDKDKVMLVDLKAGQYLPEIPAGIALVKFQPNAELLRKNEYVGISVAKITKKPGDVLLYPPLAHKGAFHGSTSKDEKQIPFDNLGFSAPKANP
jgi:prepilin-type N-terminal cleavage/methylation domain-containing protein